MPSLSRVLQVGLRSKIWLTVKRQSRFTEARFLKWSKANPWKFGIIVTAVTVGTSGGLIWLQVMALSSKFSLNTSVFDLHTNLPSYIYLDPSLDYEEEDDDDKMPQRSAKRYLRRKLEQLKKEPRFPAISSRSNNPWTLLRLAQSQNKEARLLAVQRISEQTKWSDYQYREIAQACNHSTLIGLARSPDIDSRFFLPDPKLPPPKYAIEDEFRVLLTSLPMTDIDKCVQHFTSTALHNGNVTEERGGMWCFGGNGLEFAKTLSPVPEEKVEIFCLIALASHSTIPSHCPSIIQYGGLQLLHRVCEEMKKSLVVRRLIAKIIGNIAVHKELHADIVRAGWVSTLCQWLTSPDLSLSLHSARALANLDRDARSPLAVYPQGVYLIHPKYRQKEPIHADVIFVHGLLGGPFRTWRQEDKLNIERASKIEDSDRKINYTFCWPKDWLANDCSNIRILTLEYDTYLSEWEAKCPFGSEKRSLTFRSKTLLHKLTMADVGKRPIIWVGHSMGGLLIKQMLTLAEGDPQFDAITRNTKGLIFYSVPHRGAFLAAFSNQARYLLNPSVEVQELVRDSPLLKTLHDKFLAFMNSKEIPCLSFGETKPTSLGMRLELLIVPLDSSDPGIGEFHTIDTDHLNICKPHDKDTDLYQLSLQFIMECIPKHTVRNIIRAGLAFQELIK